MVTKKSVKIKVTLKPGLLKGYHPNMPKEARRRALSRAKGTPLSIGRRLLILSTFTKRTLPKYSKVYKANSTWAFTKSKCGCGLNR